MSFEHHPKRSALLVIAVGGALAVALVASPAAAQTSATPPAFATGSVTSVHGASVQVTDQTQNRESTVVLAPTTQVSKRESAAASAITVGACVRVTGTGSTAKGIKAQSVALSAASSTGCTPGFGGGGAGGPGGFRFGNGQRPRTFGNGAGGGFRNRGGARPANVALASGPVVSISQDKMVVKSTTFTRSASAKASGKNAKAKRATARAKPSTSNVTVTLGRSAAISQTVIGTASDVAVGSCVTATGTSTAGSVDAARVVVSQPVNGACSAGFGGFGGRGGAGGATGGGPV